MVERWCLNMELVWWLVEDKDVEKEIIYIFSKLYKKEGGQRSISKGFDHVPWDCQFVQSLESFGSCLSRSRYCCTIIEKVLLNPPFRIR